MTDNHSSGGAGKLSIPDEAKTELYKRAMRYWLNLRRGELASHHLLATRFADFAIRVAASNPGSSIAEIIETIRPIWKPMIEVSLAASAYEVQHMAGRDWKRQDALGFKWEDRVSALLRVAGVPDTIEKLGPIPENLPTGSEEVKHLESSLERQPVFIEEAAADSASTVDRPRHLRRASWLTEQLRIRKWSDSVPSKHGGPDRKTIQKILRGEPVRPDTLRKLAKALGKVQVAEIPND